MQFLTGINMQVDIPCSKPSVLALKRIVCGLADWMWHD